MDRRIAQDKIIGFALGLGKQDRTATGSDFSGDIDTTQYTLSSYGALELSNKMSIPRAIASSVLVSLLVSMSFAFILIRLMS
jgi:hypothetical protein